MHALARARWSGAVVAAAALNVASASAAAAVATIEMPAQVQVGAVGSSQVTLGEVALLTSTDLPTLQRLMAVPLGHLPRAGDSVVLDRQALAQWLRSQTGVRADDFTWKGADATRISVAVRQVSGDAVVATAQSALLQWLATRSKRTELSVLEMPRDFALPDGELRLSARSLNDARPHKRMLVWVDVFSNERFIRTVPVSFVVNAFADVDVVTADAGIGSVLQPLAVSSREIDIAALPAPALTAVDVTAQPQRVRRSLRSGDVIAARDVAPAPTIARGEWATLEAHSGMVELSGKVEVLQDGWVGQMVRVKQANAASSIVARVSGPGKVEMQP